MIFHGGSCTFMGLSQISKRSLKLGSLLSHYQSRSFSCADNVGLISFRHPCFQSVSLPCLQSSLFAKDSSFLYCFYIFLVEVRDNLFSPIAGKFLQPMSYQRWQESTANYSLPACHFSICIETPVCMSKINSPSLQSSWCRPLFSGASSL